jgi:RNA-binding protein
MTKLKGYQRKYLRGAAHSLKPLILIGQKGFTPELLRSAEAALGQHELIKVKFNDYKEKDQKAEIVDRFEREAGCEMVGLIGHIAIFYREHKDPEKRKITLPLKKA